VIHAIEGYFEQGQGCRRASKECALDPEPRGLYQHYRHRHKLATLTASHDPAGSTRDQAVLTLLYLSLAGREAALRELMLILEQQAPAALDTLWAELALEIS
jgi:hypothetical protein